MLRSPAPRRPTALASALLALLVSQVGAPALAEPLAFQPTGAALPGRIAAAAPAAGGWAAVGEGGLLATRSGVDRTAPWVVERTGTTAGLHAVWAAPEGDLFAAGQRGTIVHRSPDGRVETTTLDPDRRVWHAISGRGARDVWVVGEGGAAAHYDGATWSPVATGTDRSLQAVDASAGGVYAGGFGVVIELRRTGAARVVPGLGEGRMIRALSARSARDIVALGDGLLTFDGRVWTQRVEIDPAAGAALLVRDGRRILVATRTGVAVVEGPRATSLPIAGLVLSGLRVERGAIHALALDGADILIEPTGVTIPLRLLGSGIRTAAWNLPFDAFDSEAGAVTLSGPSWTAVVDHGVVRARVRSPGEPEPRAPSGAPFEERATFRRGDEVLAIGAVPQGVAVFQREGGSWREIADPWTVARWPGVPVAIGGSPRAGDAFWMAGPGFFVRARPPVARGAGAWTFDRMRLGARGRSSSFEAITQIGPDLFAHGASTDVWRFDGRYWRAEPCWLRGATAMSRDGGLALGAALIRRNRETGTFAPIDSGGDLPSGLAGLEMGPPTAVWAASPRDVWLAREDHLWRFDGARYSGERTYVDDPIAVISGGGGGVWVTTRAGEILARTPRGLRPLPADPRVPVTAVRVLSANEAFVGSPGTILRWDGRRFVREYGSGATASTVPAWAEPRPAITSFARIDGRLYAFPRGVRAPLVRRDGRWAPAPGGDSVVHLPAAGEGRDDAPAICATLEPAGAPPMLVSCESRLVMTLSPAGWQPERIPGEGALTGAACIPGDACYLLDALGSWRAATP